MIINPNLYLICTIQNESKTPKVLEKHFKIQAWGWKDGSAVRALVPEDPGSIPSTHMWLTNV